MTKESSITGMTEGGQAREKGKGKGKGGGRNARGKR